MSRLLFKFLYAPTEGEGGMNIAPPIGNSNDKDDIINFLSNEEDDVTPPSPKKEDVKPEVKKEKPKDEEEDEEIDIKDGDDNEDDENKEDKELEDLLDDEDEPKEEQLELTTPVRRKEILKKYPELFKDFPYLEKAYYREQQFTSLLPTIDDAKQAVEAKQTLDKFETELMDGNMETVLASVKAEDGNSFYKIVDNLLPTLAKVDEGAYQHLMANTIKHTLLSMVQEAHASKNETLMAAATVLNQFAFGTSKFEPPKPLAKEVENKPDSKENELKQREQEFAKKQFDSARGDLNTRVNNALKSTIEQNIDPRGTMTDYVKRNAIRQVTEELGELVKQDSRFGQIVDRLWKNAFDKGFTKDSMDKLRTAYFSKAKTLLPSVIKKARNEALKGMGKRVRDNEEPSVKKGNQERSRSNDRSDNKENKSVPKGMSTLDFLSQD